jgi:magnesium-transporting ATPase (P-type)
MNFSLNSIQELYRLFSSSSKGLTHAEAKKNLEQYGKNILPEKKKNRLKMFLLQFHSPLIYILFAAVFISLLAPIFQNGGLHAHDLIDPIAIFAILLLNACFGYFQELKAENTLQALKSMQPNISTVLRNGKKEQISREFIVPGDVLALSEGDKIPADARLIEAHELKVIESALTGESAPVKKDPDWKGESGIADQKNMLFFGNIPRYRTRHCIGGSNWRRHANRSDRNIGRRNSFAKNTSYKANGAAWKTNRSGGDFFVCTGLFCVVYAWNQFCRRTYHCCSIGCFCCSGRASGGYDYFFGGGSGYYGEKKSDRARAPSG